jgi:hypothetical protein
MAKRTAHTGCHIAANVHRGFAAVFLLHAELRPLTAEADIDVAVESLLAAGASVEMVASKLPNVSRVLSAS